MRSANTYLSDRVGRCPRAPIRRNGNRRGGLVDPDPVGGEGPAPAKTRAPSSVPRPERALRQGADPAVDREQAAVEAALPQLRAKAGSNGRSAAGASEHQDPPLATRPLASPSKRLFATPVRRR
jgi:hypothetical protein